MKIAVNGDSHETESGISVEQLLKNLEFAHGSCAVALNTEFVPRANYAETILKEGDEVEVVAPRQGG